MLSQNRLPCEVFCGLRPIAGAKNISRVRQFLSLSACLTLFQQQSSLFFHCCIPTVTFIPVSVVCWYYLWSRVRYRARSLLLSLYFSIHILFQLLSILCTNSMGRTHCGLTTYVRPSVRMFQLQNYSTVKNEI
jgi:hypothetical protein